MRKGWEYKKLGEVLETTSGGTPSKSHKEYYEGGTIPWLRSGEVSKGDIYDAELYITEEGLKKSSAKLFPIDTVLIAMYGATVGQVGILKSTMCTNQAICGILPNKDFHPNFLKYVLLANKKNYLKQAIGGAQPNISQQVIKSTYIPIVKFSEQESVVSELDKINELIRLKKEQLKDFDNLAQSLFYEMFGDPVENEKGWEVKKLNDICDVRDGTHDSPKYLQNSEYILITSKNIVNGSIDFENVTISPRRITLKLISVQK
ncbi:restriction endonuclease subunit S [Segatella copri]|uniref:Restriction endonuclease subunit S n=1 Tax=Segatella copri TaxID=165179 RepID=A0AA93BLP9_9BACT|nr:restriction endonuclease subunit S [Segatella copri]